MHGKPRPPKNTELSHEVQEQINRKIKLLKAGSNELFKRKNEKRYDEESMKICAKILILNPEMYTGWNYRKEALNNTCFEVDDDIPNEEKTNVSKFELGISAQALDTNEKSYCAWYHRRWIMKKGYVNVVDEMKYVEKKLLEDVRNFHAWNYRHFLHTEFQQVNSKIELNYSQLKINQNFSNFSAWFLRSKHLPMVEGKVPVVSFKDIMNEKTDDEDVKMIHSEILDKEYEMMHSAFATDPDDTSAWFYYRWLLSNSLTLYKKSIARPDEEKEKENFKNVLNREINVIENDILKIESNDFKWPLLALIWLKSLKKDIFLNDQHEISTIEFEIKNIYEKLINLDPKRKGFYQDCIMNNALIFIKSF